MSRFSVKKVAVLGAGVMGAQIAAHLANLRVPVLLFDLPAAEGPKSGIVPANALVERDSHHKSHHDQSAKQVHEESASI